MFTLWITIQKTHHDNVVHQMWTMSPDWQPWRCIVLYSSISYRIVQYSLVPLLNFSLDYCCPFLKFDLLFHLNSSCVCMCDFWRLFHSFISCFRKQPATTGEVKADFRDTWRQHSQYKCLSLTGVRGAVQLVFHYYGNTKEAREQSFVINW